MDASGTCTVADMEVWWPPPTESFGKKSELVMLQGIDGTEATTQAGLASCNSLGVLD
jgi:hypothetical protein